MQQIRKEELFIFSVYSWKQIVKSICPFAICSECAVCTNTVWPCWQNASLVSVPRMEGIAALSADCVPDRWHKCCHFPLLPLTKPDVLSSSDPHLIWNLATADSCWPLQGHVYIFALSTGWCEQSVATLTTGYCGLADAVCFTPALPWWDLIATVACSFI